MEHEFFVPVAPARLSRALRSRAHVVGALPGWQPEPGPEGTGTGRLRLRVAGSTITYRGTVGVAGEESPFTAEATGTEVRGTGTVKAVLEIVLAEATRPEPGTLLTFRGAAEADGRLATYDAAVVEAAVRRLLDRFSTELAAHAPEAEEAAAKDTAAEDAAVEDAAEETAPLADAPLDAPAEPAPGPRAAEEPAAVPAEETAAVPAEEPAEPAAEEPAEEQEPPAEPPVPEEPETDVVDDLGEPAPADGLDDFELVEVEVEVPESAAALDDLVPPAEAAHARRTMIGRSAEEVDHAPPRGRYAPVPAPDAGSAAATLRWAAPAAAALVASAVVVGRVLRRRR